MLRCVGGWLFLLAPGMLAGWLLWWYPAYRRFRWRSLLLYFISMSVIIWGALHLVAYIASGRVKLSEVLVVLWFTVTWRLAWEIWARSVGRLGQRWVRWRRLQKRRGLRTPHAICLIPAARATLTGLVFVTAFLSAVITHRCKIDDGQNPLGVFNMPFEHVRIPTHDGLTLDGWFVPDSDGGDRTIVVCHGAGANKGNFIWFLAPLANHGCNVLFFDFRAHGGSDGRVTTYGIHERIDVLAAVDWLKRNKPAQARTIVGLGSSQGSLALALAAAEDGRIDAIILDSPFVSPRELVLQKAGYVPLVGPIVGRLLLAEVSVQTGADFFAASAEEAVARMAGRPVMVIHGDRDFVMPRVHSERLYTAATGPRAIWFGPGPHSNIATEAPHEYARRVFAFVEENLGRPTTDRSAGRARTATR